MAAVGTQAPDYAAGPAVRVKGTAKLEHVIQPTFDLKYLKFIALTK